MGNRIFLMFPQLNFGIHTAEYDMASVILTGTDTVELLIVEPDKLFTAVRIIPNPVLKALLDKLLLRLCNLRFLVVENCFLSALIILNIIENTDIFHIQRFFNNLIGVNPACAVGIVCFHIGTVIGFPLNIPFAREL